MGNCLSEVFESKPDATPLLANSVLPEAILVKQEPSLVQTVNLSIVYDAKEKAREEAKAKEEEAKAREEEAKAKEEEAKAKEEEAKAREEEAKAKEEEAKAREEEAKAKEETLRPTISTEIEKLQSFDGPKKKKKKNK